MRWPQQIAFHYGDLSVAPPDDCALGMELAAIEAARQFTHAIGTPRADGSGVFTDHHYHRQSPLFASHFRLHCIVLITFAQSILVVVVVFRVNWESKIDEKVVYLSVFVVVRKEKLRARVGFLLRCGRCRCLCSLLDMTRSREKIFSSKNIKLIMLVTLIPFASNDFQSNKIGL